KRSVSYYFIDPFGSSKAVGAKRTAKSGTVIEGGDAGAVPEQDSVAYGRGRNTYLERGQSSPSKELVSDWGEGDQNGDAYWREQAQRQRDHTEKERAPGEKADAAKEAAVQRLAEQLHDEVTRGIPASTGIYRDLFFESLQTVNWREIAEDLLGR